MHYTSAAILVAGLAAQQAAATGWSVGAKHYSNPFNHDNKCSSEQSSGYDWASLGKGSFSSYGSNSFSGFTCTDTPGKRDVLSKRTFQDKCISGKLHEQPSMSCDDNDDMSPQTYHVSSSHDADVDCEYEMPDGSICKQTHSCSSEGSIIENSQCGGAKKVTFKPGKNAPDDCSINFHSIGFHCGSASSSVPASTATPSSYATSSSSVVLTTSSSSVPVTSDVPSVGYSSSIVVNSTTPVAYDSTSSIPVPYTTSSVSSSPSAYSSSSVSSSPSAYSSSSVGTAPVLSSSSSVVVPVYNITTMSSSAPIGTAPASSKPIGSSSVASPVTESVPMTTSTIYTTTQSTITSCASTVTNCPADSTAVVTSTIAIGTTVCPVSEISETSSVAVPTSYSAPAGNYSLPATSSTEVSPVESTSASESSYPTPDTPGVLPSCLNSWLFETDCKDNSDSDCYCKDEKFMKDVYGCISAWCNEEGESDAAASQLMGICAPHVPSNPAIITACPSTAKTTDIPKTSSVAAPVSSAPVSSADVSSAPVSSAAVSSAPVSSAAVSSAPVSSAAVSSAVVSSAPVPSTQTIYQTKKYTITSCAPDVTNCPASSTQIVTSSVAISTTIVTPTAPASYEVPASSSEAAPVSTAPISSAPAVPSTITLYSTAEVTVTSCGPEVQDCPAGSTVVKTSSYATATTVTLPAAPASSGNGYVSSKAPESAVTEAPSHIPAYGGKGSTVVATSVATITSAAQPMTTIIYSAPATYQATYTTGVSSGLTIPSSKITTELVTTVTVPQVQFTTSTVVVDGQTSTVPVLAAGSPSNAPASATSVGAVGPTTPAQAPGYTSVGTSFGTSFAPSATGPSSSPIAPYTGAGAKLSGASFAGLAIGAFAALFVL